jgi:ubiquinone/menaquinone biosynthesis C-methylase UbiE
MADYKAIRIEHWDGVAKTSDNWRGLGSYYHARLTQVYRDIVPAGQRVLELGCGQGDLLAALEPRTGIGIDFSPEMLKRAETKHPELDFVSADTHNLLKHVSGEFDFIVLSDLINDLWDVQTVLEQITPLCNPKTRIIMNYYSRVWGLPLAIAQSLRIAKPTLAQNWLTKSDVAGLLSLSNFEVIRSWNEFIWPIRIPVLATFLNKYLAKIWPFSQLTLANFLLARPLAGSASSRAKEPSVSVVIPARNEAGNIEQIFKRVPQMGSNTELIFVEGHSQDHTYQAVQDAMAKHPQPESRLYRQTGIGKGDAVRLGFSEASGDILMILDADLTVPPEDLPRFYKALNNGKAEFANGVRLVYPMEDQAMRFLNLLGNKFFSMAFSWLLGQPVKDTLCGTKVLWKEDYERIAANRAYFGEFDPFGDFDLLFGAAKLNLKILDIPIRYRERKYGTTNISRWRHGLLLVRMVLFAANRIKFV